MDLLNRLTHMRGKAVLVNGHCYDIDKEGIAHNVITEDAKKLLMSKNVWGAYPDNKGKPSKPSKPKKAVEPVKEPVREPIKELVEAKAVDKVSGDGSNPVAEGEEWPDPDMKMGKDYLLRMADAYEIDGEGLTKKELVEKILEAMY